MPEVVTPDIFLSQTCITACLIELQKLTEQDQVLTIKATAFVEDVDILLIGYFLLFRRHYLRPFPKFRINLVLTQHFKPPGRAQPKAAGFEENTQRLRREIAAYNLARRQPQEAPLDERLGRTLRQYMAYAYLQTNGAQPFTVTYGYHFNYRSDVSPVDDISIYTSSKLTWFDISEKFTPVFNITPKSYPQFFLDPLPADSVEQSLFVAVKNSEELFQHCKEQLTAKIFLVDEKGGNGLGLLARLSFYQAVNQAKVLNFYLRPDNADTTDMQAGSLQGDPALAYFEEIKPLLDDIAARPMIFQFLFAVLVSTEQIPSRLNQHTRRTMVQSLDQLWKFTRELTFGLQELAKNIIEHSQPNKKHANGIITARIYQQDRYSGRPAFAAYLSYLAEEKKTAAQYFELQVADDGPSGVLETLYRNTCDEIARGGSDAKLLQADADQLSGAKIGFYDLLDAASGLRLNQQVKRATAHLGLLSLSQLISNNAGMLRAGTWETTAARTARFDEALFARRRAESSLMVPWGTTYNIILPIDSSSNYQPKFFFETQAPPVITPEYIHGMEALITYRLVDYSAAAVSAAACVPDSIIDIRLDQKKAAQVPTEFWDFFPLRGEKHFETLKAKNALVCWNAAGASVDISKLSRFLGRWELEFPGLPLIINNLRAEDYFRLLQLNKVYIGREGLPYWNSNSLILFYTFKEKDRRRFYFTDALWGKDLNDFVVLNRLIRRTDFNALATDIMADALYRSNAYISDGFLENLQPLAETLDHFPVFRNNNNLLPLSLLLRGYGKTTLFEHNAAFLLENKFELYKKPEVRAATDSLEQYMAQIPGFLIPKTHFRIGSKVHISRFYYGKRFFQNSFFASPVAFLVARDILSNQLKAILDTKEKTGAAASLLADGITLVGYGKYSELLLSMVQQFLGKIIVDELFSKQYDPAAGLTRTQYQEQCLQQLKLNHDLVDENDEFVRVKNEKLHKRVILIIPIATTFSTSIKIAEELRKNPDVAEILTPHINVIYVYHDADDALPAKFGINDEDKENKLVKVSAFFNRDNAAAADIVDPIEQRFLLGMPSTWHDIEDCDICFPQEPKRERPLFITDKTSVNPVLIFGLPKGKELEEHQQNNFVLTPAMVRYGHYLGDGNHYLYYIYVEEFFNQNKALIRDWLNKLKADERFTELRPGTFRVVMVAPGHRSNTSFLNLVNEVLFYNSANIIHYEPDKDHIQNFQLFYEKEIQHKDIRLIYVDDVMTTGASFIRTNYFVKHTRPLQKGFDAAIVLIDRSSNFVHNNITRKLTGEVKRYFSFANLNLPSLKPSDQDCPLCLEYKRYLELADNSFLDKLRRHFLHQAEKLRPVDIETLRTDVRKAKSSLAGAPPAKQYSIVSRHMQLDPTDPQRYIRRIDVIHRIFSWFFPAAKTREFLECKEFEEWKSLLALERSPFAISRPPDDQPPGTAVYQSGPDNDALVKVVTQSPFTQYKPFKEKVFKWIVQYLDNQRAAMETHIKAGLPVSDAAFRQLKFLIRRAGLLNSNYLIADGMFDLLYLLLSADGMGGRIIALEAEIAEIQAGIKVRNAYVRAQRSIDDDRLDQLQSRCDWFRHFNVFYLGQVKELIHLNEARSIRLEQKLAAQQARPAPGPLFRQLLRILQEENGVLIRKFWDFVRDLLPSAVEKAEYFSNNAIFLALNTDSVLGHYRYTTLKSLMSVSGVAEPITDQSFLGYLWLMNYLSREAKLSLQTLNTKTELICQKLMDIVADGAPEAGIFLIVKYKREREDSYFIAYNFGKTGRMDEALWNTEAYPFLFNFLNGTQDKAKRTLTITELKKTVQGWADEYTLDADPIEKTLSPQLLAAGYDKLLLTRLNRRTVSFAPDNQLGACHEDNPLGLVGIYYRENQPDPLHAYRVRYLLLLRDALSSFIENHHENNEFRDWIDASNSSRIALLTGHGREMLIAVANKKFPGKAQDSKPYKTIVSTLLLVQRFLMDEQDHHLLKIPAKHIEKVFKDFFLPKASEIRTRYFKTDICNMARDIFEFNEVENTEPVTIDDSSIGEVNFQFPCKILDLICFELLVNAKKNRWIFRAGQPFGGLDQNRIRISARQRPGTLVVVIENTGARLLVQKLNELNDLDNPKPNSSSSGVSLIKRMLKVFKLGEISFTQAPDSIQDELTTFSATLTLTKWQPLK